MSSGPVQRRRMVEFVLVVLIALVGWYISRPHPPDGPREVLHWGAALVAAYLLSAAAWSVIRKPNRILISLGYLMFGISMTLSFIEDLAPAQFVQRVGWYSLAALYAGFVLFWLDYRKHGFGES